MIIPVRCFTCNLVIASKYPKYQELVKKYQEEGATINTISVDSDLSEQSAAQKAFQELHLDRYCCRRHLLSHIDLIDQI
jgi:DNA-directed RNA polymerase subunit N (RpoN/RPB10)